ncbi:MlaA family lipoprotein [Alteromonas oceanisediminis]|uniref:MlaA family lipoprotein n=1 Tax=Alteromonas oceanisediminis TaxID=2836180 RepID=UPI001BDB6A1E|nr:VacJ family lipoprotein [Alteromonas oceanisediminis]MBT0586689.1 VacJ family lipoprotein [Alteromonas oceanisediminis]
MNVGHGFARLSLGICTAFFITACSSVPDDAETQPSQPADEQSHVSKETLSQGKAVTIQTSQGVLQVEPTVVDMVDEDGGSGEPTVYYDPLEPFNRAIFKFNHVTYTYALLPAARGYKAVVPAPVRQSIGNAFDNIREPVNLLNNLATGNVEGAGTNLGRFLINSTIGVLGLFDPASTWFDIPPQQQTIGDALAHYHVGSGAYLVLPFLGQSSVRGTTSLIGEGFLNPIRYLTSPPDTYYLYGTDGFSDFSEQSDPYEELYQQAEDPYLYFRNQYLQGVKRDAAFKD